MDLGTMYMGLKLKNPIVPSSSPLTGTLDGLRRLEDAGAAAVVLPSLFEEQIELDARQIGDLTTGIRALRMDEIPAYYSRMVRPEEYATLVQAAKSALAIPVIASLNGTTAGGWVKFAALLEDAGADAIELNLNVIVTDPGRSAAQIELGYMEPVRTVLADVAIPVAVKLGYSIGSLPYLAQWMSHEGVRGLVLFNRFYQPDIDLELGQVVPQFSYSRSEDMRLPLRWVAILYGRVGLDFAITSGVHTHFDVIKGIKSGASVMMMASELLENGPHRIVEVLADMTHWMEGHECESLEAMRGSMSQKNIADPELFERSEYIQVLQSYRRETTDTVPSSGPGRHPAAVHR